MLVLSDEAESGNLVGIWGSVSALVLSEQGDIGESRLNPAGAGGSLERAIPECKIWGDFFTTAVSLEPGAGMKLETVPGVCLPGTE